MDLRTKLVFALVGVSLGSMLTLGAFSYRQGRDMLRESSLEKLAAVAESRRQDLENVMSGWADRVSLIGSRTQLRQSLAAYVRSGSDSERQRITRILDDARSSVGSVELLAVFDTLGNAVTASWSDPRDEGDGVLSLDSADLAVAEDRPDPALLGIEVVDDGRRQVRYLAPLTEQGVHVGWLLARLSAAELLRISRDFTGLGLTGETMVVRREAEGLRVLHPVRHEGLLGGSFIPERADGLDPASVATAGQDTLLADDVTDYRNHPVWAATRFVPGPGWGIVVKIDEEEERRPIVELRDRMVRLAISLSAFAILIGILLGLQLSRPLQELVEVANRIRAGETRARARVRSQDEVGLLARTFNRMADALTASNVSISDADLTEEAEAARADMARERAAEENA